MRITNTLRVLVSVLPENLRQEGRTLAAAIEAPSAYEMVRPLGIAEAHGALWAKLTAAERVVARPVIRVLRDRCNAWLTADEEAQ